MFEATKHNQPHRQGDQALAEQLAELRKLLLPIRSQPVKPFNNAFARVRHELVVQPSGMPPDHWALCDQVNRADPFFPRGEFQ